MRRRLLGPRGKRGLTLIELMAAINILVVAIFAAFSTELTCMNTLRVSKETSTAASELETAMEQILLLPFDNIPTTFLEGVAIGAYNDRVLNNERVIPNYPNYVFPGPAGDPLEIQVTITWTDWRGRARSLTLSSMKTR